MSTAMLSSSLVLAESRGNGQPPSRDKQGEKERESRGARSEAERPKTGPHDPTPPGATSADPRHGRPGDEKDKGNAARPEGDSARPPSKSPGADANQDGTQSSRLRPEERDKRLKELQGKDEKALSDSELDEFKRLRLEADREKPTEQRRSRVEELKARQTKGKLTRVEKVELDKEASSVERHEALEKKNEERKKDRDARRSRAQSEVAQSHPKLAQDAETTAELKSHAERLAKLERARELAVADDRAETVAKVDALVVKENTRHQTWIANHESQVRTK